MPEALRVQLIRLNGWEVCIHGYRDCREYTRSKEPKYDGDGERNDISNAASEVEKKEEVANEAAYERGDVQVDTPVRIWKANGTVVDPYGLGVVVLSPGRYEGSNRHDIGSRAHGSCKQRYGGGSKPPVSVDSVSLRVSKSRGPT